jgi:hypothetical protein
LRDLPLAARLTLATFLISVGIGYISALVQLHFQHAEPGEVLPGESAVIAVFHGSKTKPVSVMERLITAPENLSFNVNGQMTVAFTTRSEGWKSDIKARAKALAKKRNEDKPAEHDLRDAELDVRKERLGERDVLVAWIREGSKKEDYEKDSYTLNAKLKDQPITPSYLVEGDVKAAKIKSILQDRCVRCHAKQDGDANAVNYPLETYAELEKYLVVPPGETMPPKLGLEKLAQSTHVHLLGFSMLYGLTGFLLAMTSWNFWVRCLLAPLPLIAQVIDISCWWLARIPGDAGVFFALVIPATGGIVALGLVSQILLTLFGIFERMGRMVIVGLLLLAVVLGLTAKFAVVDPYFAAKNAEAKTVEVKAKE